MPHPGLSDRGVLFLELAELNPDARTLDGFDAAYVGFDFNVIGAWVGNGTPCFLKRMEAKRCSERRK